MSLFAPEFELVREALPQRVCGVVAALRGLTVVVDALPLPVGSLVSVESRRGGVAPMLGEIVGFSGRFPKRSLLERERERERDKQMCFPISPKTREKEREDQHLISPKRSAKEREKNESTAKTYQRKRKS